jgi:hypothetical protein
MIVNWRDEHVDVPGDVGLELLLVGGELGEVLPDLVCTMVRSSAECDLRNAPQNDVSNVFETWGSGEVRESDLPEKVLA